MTFNPDRDDDWMDAYITDELGRDQVREQQLSEAYAKAAARYHRPDIGDMVEQFRTDPGEPPRLPPPIQVDPWRPKHCEGCGAELSPSKLILECLECRLTRLMEEQK